MITVLTGTALHGTKGNKLLMGTMVHVNYNLCSVIVSIDNQSIVDYALAHCWLSLMLVSDSGDGCKDYDVVYNNAYQSPAFCNTP